MSDLAGSGILISEFIGTALLLLLGVGVVANVSLSSSYGYGRDWLLIALGWGFAVFAGASVAWKSGAQLNPAVTFALALTGTVPWDQVPWYWLAQVTGAFFGACLAYLAYKKQFDAEADRSTTGGIFFTAPAVHSPGWNVLTEAIGTFVLVYWVLQSTPFTPGTGDLPPEFGNAALGYAGVAFVVMAIGGSLGGPTGYAINPARDFGPRLMYALLPMKGKGSANWSYSWVPVVGPLAGAAAAAGVFDLVGG